METTTDTTASVNNSIFTKEELELMELTKTVRVDSIKELVSGGVPTKTNELRILNELATSLDKQVTDNAANRLKHEQNNNHDDVLDMVANTLKNISTIATASAVVKITELPNTLLPSNIVPGEDTIEADILVPTDFIDTDKK